MVGDLLVTELITNSIRHASAGPMDPIEVRIELDDRKLRIEVRDRGTVAPALPAPGASSDGGYGLLFVENLADRWGSERRRQGTSVWFELDLT